MLIKVKIFGVTGDEFEVIMNSDRIVQAIDSVEYGLTDV
jgi:hypothetical protein